MFNYSDNPMMTMRSISFLICFVVFLFQASAQETANVPLSPGEAGYEETIPLGAGDTISLTLLEDQDVRYEGVIGEAGIIRLPYLGDFQIAGLTVEAATSTLEQALERDLYQQATVSLYVVSRAPGTVYIYGAVKTPGAVQLPIGGNLSVLQAVSKVGGVTAWADAENCYVTRLQRGTRERQRLPVDLSAAFQDIGGKEDILLKPNDVLFIPAKNSQVNEVLSTEPVEVIVAGEVNEPGIIYFAPGESRTVMRAIFKAGNFTRFAKSKEVRVVRAEGQGRDVEIVDVTAIIDQGLLDQDTRLEPGDMVIVDQKMFSFQ